MGPLPTPTASAETTSAPSCPAPCKQQQQQQQRGVCVCQADCIFACVSERDEMRRTRPCASVRRSSPPTCAYTLANMREELSDKKKQQAQERSRGARLLATMCALQEYRI